jgi:hypothetical protein
MLARGLRTELVLTGLGLVWEEGDVMYLWITISIMLARGLRTELALTGVELVLEEGDVMNRAMWLFVGKVSRGVELVCVSCCGECDGSCSVLGACGSTTWGSTQCAISLMRFM